MAVTPTRAGRRLTARSSALTAVEVQSEIAKAVHDFEARFSEGAQKIGRLKADVRWQPEVGTWGLFHRKANAGYWNVFGREKREFGRNILVEINPPRSGKNTNVQGCIAETPARRRWLLHSGKIHVGGVRITREMFDEVTKLRRVNVTFSDGSVVSYHRVACIDDDAAEVQQQVAAFAGECRVVRLHYTYGPSIAELERKVEAAEGPSHPERPGSYETPPRDRVTARRWHADIWKALTVCLDGRRILHKNGRLGAFGPDLWTIGTPRVLFEIKVRGTAADVEQGVGQLLLYEKLLDVDCIKVLIVPEGASELTGAANGIGVTTLRYRKSGDHISFWPRHLGIMAR